MDEVCVPFLDAPTELVVDAQEDAIGDEGLIRLIPDRIAGYGGLDAHGIDVCGVFVWCRTTSRPEILLAFLPFRFYFWMRRYSEFH